MFEHRALKHSVFLFTHAYGIFETDELEEKTIQGFVEFSCTTSSDIEAKSLMDIKAIFDAVDNRTIGVENMCSTEYEKEKLRNNLILYLLNMVEHGPHESYIPDEISVARGEYIQQVKTEEYNTEEEKTKRVEDQGRISGAVSKFLQDKSYIDLRKVKLYGHTLWLKEIIRENPQMEKDLVRVEESMEEMISILTNVKILVNLEKLAKSLFKSAGSLRTD